MTIDEFTSIPLSAKNLINNQHPIHEVLFFAYGDGTWSAELVVDEKKVELSGVYSTDDWMIIDEERR